MARQRGGDRRGLLRQLAAPAPRGPAGHAVVADYAALIRPTNAVGRESEAYPATKNDDNAPFSHVA
jgi:hypothetical protein